MEKTVKHASLFILLAMFESATPQSTEIF
jgi:hypothetical protein